MIDLRPAVGEQGGEDGGDDGDAPRRSMPAGPGGRVVLGVVVTVVMAGPFGSVECDDHESWAAALVPVVTLQSGSRATPRDEPGVIPRVTTPAAARRLPSSAWTCARRRGTTATCCSPACSPWCSWSRPLAYGGDLLSAVAAVLARAALAVRRRLPVVGLLVLLAACLRARSGGRLPGRRVDSRSSLVFSIAHYSLGRWARAAERPGSARSASWPRWWRSRSETPSDNDVAISEIGLGSVAFTVGFVGAPWAAGLAIRLRRERETELDRREPAACAGSRRSTPPARSPRSAPGSPASCTTWSPTPSP